MNFIHWTSCQGITQISPKLPIPHKKTLLEYIIMQGHLINAGDAINTPRTRSQILTVTT